MRKIENSTLRSQAASVTLTVFDVDGIMSDGSLHFLPDAREVNMFITLDRLGVKLLHNAGIETALITGRRSPKVKIRSETLGMTYLRQGRDSKLESDYKRFL